jgi:hypothetical protein
VVRNGGTQFDPDVVQALLAVQRRLVSAETPRMVSEELQLAIAGDPAG